MDSKVEFIEGHLDNQNEVSALHLSFLVQTLLPLHTVKWEEVKRHYLSINADFDDKFADDEELHCISTGSMAEGYSIPSSIRRDETSGRHTVEILSDVDILTVMSKLKISTEDNLVLPISPNSEGFKGQFEYIPESPGYVRIRVLNPKADDEIFIIDPVSGKYYFSGTKWSDKMFTLFNEREATTRQGPALTLVDHTLTPTLKLKEGISTDLVFALPCYPWPKIANQWKDRVKKSDWLSVELVDSIIKDGCHVVAVPSKTSETPDVEWRVSFSTSEGKLAREAVTDFQRQCFIYVKILHHQAIKPKCMLSSYMFKSVFLHCCEKLPVSNWKDSPGGCVLYVLDTVLDCLKRKHIPTYFFPENNLIRHMTDDEIQEITEIVECVRKDPVSPVLQYTDGKIFNRHSVLISFRKMVSPLLDDMADFKTHKDVDTSIMNGMMNTAFRICMFNLAEKAEENEKATLMKHQEGIRHLINVHGFWFKKLSRPPLTTLPQFINDTGLAIKHPIRALRYFEAAVRLSSEYPEFAALRGNLACMYHGASYINGLSEEMQGIYIGKAEASFKEAFESDGVGSVDYVTFLVKLGKLEEAKIMAEQLLIASTKTGSETSINRFDAKEKDCLVEQLKTHVEEHGHVTGDSISFVYFYLVYICTRSENNAGKVTELIRGFEDHYRRRNDTDTLILLNHARTMADTVN